MPSIAFHDLRMGSFQMMSSYGRFKGHFSSWLSSTYVLDSADSQAYMMGSVMFWGLIGQLKLNKKPAICAQ